MHKIVCLWSQFFFDEEEENSTFYFTPGLKTSFKKKVSPTLVKQKKVASSGRNWASHRIIVQDCLLFPPTVDNACSLWFIWSRFLLHTQAI